MKEDNKNKLTEAWATTGKEDKSFDEMYGENNEVFDDNVEVNPEIAKLFESTKVKLTESSFLDDDFVGEGDDEHRFDVASFLRDEFDSEEVFDDEFFEDLADAEYDDFKQTGISYDDDDEFFDDDDEDYYDNDDDYYDADTGEFDEDRYFDGDDLDSENAFEDDIPEGYQYESDIDAIDENL